MKEELKAVSRHKFRTWRRAFTVFFIIFTLSFIVGAVIGKNGVMLPRLARLTSVFGLDFPRIFKTLAKALIPFFILFVFGPTIYAPVASTICIVLSGIMAGGESAYLFSVGRWGVALFEAIFSSAVNYLMILYATMVTLTALRIFTDRKKDSSPEIFEGSLFCASGFRGIFNYRYVLSYIGFYIFISLVTAGVTLVRAFAVMLV